MRILHVTEAMAGGVLTLLASLSKRQVEQGADVTIYFVPRSDTPADAALEVLFDPQVKLVHADAGNGRIGRSLELARQVRSASTSSLFDLIHLHSSVAGGIGRLAALAAGKKCRIAYSPHGFAFLRANKSALVRFGTLAAEFILARFGYGLILTSKSEQGLAENRLRKRDTLLLNTGIDPSEITRKSFHPEIGDAKLRVGMVGRICYQKAPWRFVNVAEQLRGQAEFVWIGDGEKAEVDSWFSHSDVGILGWLPADELRRAMDTIDVLLFPTLWEGMSIALMQAQARGIPAVVSDAVGNVDSVVDERTGFICSTDEEMVKRVALLLGDAELRSSMAAEAQKWANESLTDRNVGKDSLALYGSLISEGASR